MGLFSSKSSNPALKEGTFQNLKQAEDSGKMTVRGTINKSVILLLISFAASLYLWNNMESLGGNVNVYSIGSAILGLVIAIIITFKKDWAPYLAPLYALVEGVFLGIISARFEAMYNGIALQAVILTFSVFIAMLFLYRTEVIKVTHRFRMMIFGATAGIGLVYIVSLVLSFFDIQVPYLHSNGLIGIGVSIFIVSIAALNLMLDFDLVEKGSKNGAPKYMEWYCSFALLVTVVWLYIEMLRLLSKLASKK